MRVVGIKVLKNKLSEYVKLAAGGERVLITDRDRVVAVLSAPDGPPGTLAADARLGELVRTGLVQPPLVRGQGPPPNLPVATFAEIMRELDEDRADR